MADKDKLRFLTGQEANLKDKTLVRGQVYFAISSDTDSGKIYFDAPIDKNTTKRILMSSDHAKTADKATAADRATADSNGRKFTETYVSEIKLDNAGTTILYKYPDITTWKELKPKFLPLTGGTITGELYADSITAGDLLVNGSARFVNTILGNIETANQWKTARGFQIADSDAAHTSVSVNVNGSSNVVLKLPSTIKAALQGNADTATKATNDSNNKKITDEYLHRASNTSSTLNQFSGAPKYLLGIEAFTDGGEVKWQSVDSVKVGSASGADKWNTAVNFQVSDSDAAHTGTAVPVNGSKAIVLPLPATIKATLEGNASSANKVNHKYTLTLGKTKQTAFDGSADVSITITPESIGALSKDEASAGAAKWSTARMFYVADADASNTGTGVSVDGTKDITLKLPSTIKGNLKGNADTATTATNADKLDGYHRAGLYSSPGEWITANGYTKTITVNGNADTYYPVVISTTTEKSALNYISVWKNLGTKTATYPYNHSNGTSSMWLIYEGRNWYWDGNGGYLKCWYYSMPYATLCAKAEQANNGVGALVVYLRGGGTEYNISTTYNSTVTVYYETTNLGNTTHPVNVTPTTMVENRGQLSSTYLGYGNVPTADAWKTARNFAITDNDASHTGPTVSVNGSASVTLQLPAIIKASITGHASEDLPLAGGTMTGNISYKGSKATSSMIRFLNNTTDTSGNGISIGGGGVTVIGAGESSQNLTPAANEEALYLTSDGSIKFYTYCDTIGNKRGVILDTSRNFYPDVNNNGSIGTSSNKWNSMYATTFYGALSGTASNATSDIRGNAIINTYLTNVYAKSDDSSYLYKQVGPASERSAELIGRYTPLDSDGLINMKYIPAAALERVVVVANQTAQYALTTANVQLGDVVKRNDTGQLYFVVDTNNLGNAGGYLQFTAGTAANVNWSGILNRPNIVGSASTKNIITLNNAKTVFTINRVNGDGTADSYTLSPSFLPLAGGTMTGNIVFADSAFSANPTDTPGISWSGGTDGAKIFYRQTANNAGSLVLQVSDDGEEYIQFRHTKGGVIYLKPNTRELYPSANNTGSIGTTSYKWANMYATTFHGSLDGTANRAINDTNGKKITETYISEIKLDAAGTTIQFKAPDQTTYKEIKPKFLPLTGGTITGELYVDGGTTLASLLVNGDARFVNTIQGSISGNAGSANKWATAKAFYIADAEAKHTSSPQVNIDGSQSSYTLKLPSVIKATLEGNADSASRLTNLTEGDQASSTDTWRRIWFTRNDNIHGRPAYSDTFAYQSSTGTVKATKFQGVLVGNATSADKWSTARNFITNLGSESSASVDGSTGPYNLGVTGILPILHGGTGASTAAEARNNLGITTLLNAGADKGVNKWLITQYAVTQANSNTNSYRTIEEIIDNNLVPVCTYEYADTSLNISSMGQDITEYYTLYARTYLYFRTATNYAINFYSDDAASVYVNGVKLFTVDTSVTTASTIAFKKGWNVVEVVVHEHTGGDGFRFNTSPVGLSGVTNLVRMDCFMEGVCDTYWNRYANRHAYEASIWKTSRTFITALNSESPANVNGSANATLGVSGTLPISHGGTGQNDLSKVSVGNADKLDNYHAYNFKFLTYKHLSAQDENNNYIWVARLTPTGGYQGGSITINITGRFFENFNIKAHIRTDQHPYNSSSIKIYIDGNKTPNTNMHAYYIKNIGTSDDNPDSYDIFVNTTEWGVLYYKVDNVINLKYVIKNTVQTGFDPTTATEIKYINQATEALKADRWTTSRTFITALNSESPASVNGTANVTMGVYGTLPVSHGGTGQTSIANIQAGKDGDGNTITSKYVSIYNSNNIGSSASVTVNDLAKQGSAVGMINAATDNPFGKASWVHVWSQAWNKTVNTSWVSQIALGVDESDGMWYRTKEGTIVGASWTRVIDSNNYNNYAVKKASSSTDNAIVRWDGTDGRRIQNSLLSINDEGLLTLQTGNHIGAKLGSAYITSANSSNGEVILQNGHLRFGSDDWDYNQWAGLKYVHSSKIIYLGLADGTIFTANSAQYGGTLALPGIRYFSINGKIAIDANDGWLRINEGKAFATGVYFGSNVVRTDGQLQVGDSGSKFYANSSGNGYFSNTLGIGGTNTSYKLYVNGTSYINGNTTVNGWLKVQNTTDSKNSQDSNASVAIQGGVSVAKQLSAKTIRIDGSSSDTTGSTAQGCTVHFNKTNNCIEFVFD